MSIDLAHTSLFFLFEGCAGVALSAWSLGPSGVGSRAVMSNSLGGPCPMSEVTPCIPRCISGHTEASKTNLKLETLDHHVGHILTLSSAYLSLPLEPMCRSNLLQGKGHSHWR